MCGIFAYLLAQQSKGQHQTPFSWRQLWNQLYTIKDRGPDNTQLKQISKNCVMGFTRLRINDVSESGDQPLKRGNVTVIANAEIYNYRDIKEKYGFEFTSGTDCEIFLHLYEKFGDINSVINELDGVFAFVLHDANRGVTFVGRDPIGVRPVFIGQDVYDNYVFASEAKVLVGLCRPDSIRPFPPGSHWDSQSEQFVRFWHPTHNLEDCDLATYDEGPDLKKTAELLQKAVIKRMLSDRSIGTFLSGGLDSSLVAAFIMKYIQKSAKQPQLNTFSIGLEGSPDLLYSRIVAEYIGSTHHHVEIEGSDCLGAVEDVVYATETFDVTTVRASTPMYLLSRYIRENSKDVVIYSGEGSDEVTQGYLYFKKQPNSREGALEAKRLVDQLYEFDVLRVDRTTAAHGLEVREPFLDREFMQHYFNLPANIKCPRKGIEKYHLRKAIDVTFPGLLPDEILWRQKEAFSDGVSSFKKKSWVEELKEHANNVISDEQFEMERFMYNPVPMFKDALFLRRVYNKFYGDVQPQLVSKYWVPSWSGENPDSSARLLDIFNADEEDEKLKSSILRGREDGDQIQDSQIVNEQAIHAEL